MEIDDILVTAKKRVNSSRKGKCFERDLVDILKARFKLPFARNPSTFGSGAWSTTHDYSGLDMNAIAGDIITPLRFKYTIECKSGYDIELINLFSGANRKSDSKTIDGFIEQVERDAGRVNKLPLIIYRKNLCLSLALLKETTPVVQYMRYRDYYIVSLQDLLELPHNFFFPAA